MEYLIIGLLLGIGWHVAKLLFSVIEELLFTRLHKAKWYQIVAGKRPRKAEATMDVKTIKNKIGF
jgi:hypothetical protein